MSSFSLNQTGQAGDITAGMPPADYVNYPYIEWYSQQNGRVVIELEPAQVKVIGQPIPACESDPIDRAEQAANMRTFLAGLGSGAQAPLKDTTIHSDPAFTHWVLLEGKVVGEAHSVEDEGGGISFAFVRLFGMDDLAEFGTIETQRLRHKSDWDPNSGR
jgi:hypothetical protein